MRLIDRLNEHARQRGEQVAYVEVCARGRDRSISYAQLASQTASVSTSLKAHTRDDAVVLVLHPNSIDFPPIVLGALDAGRDVFPLSPEIAASELEVVIKVLRNAGRPVVAFCAEALREVVRPLVDAVPPGDMDARGEPRGSLRNGSQSSLFLQTSGSTGRPKIARRDAASIDAVSAAMVEAIGFTPPDRVLATVPLCHSYGLEHGLLAPVWAGSTVELCRGLDLPTVVRRLRDGVTIFPSVPSVFEMLADVSDCDFLPTTLKLAYSAGGPLPRSVFDTFLSKTHIRVGQLYGATEIGSVTFNDPRDAGHDPAGVGKPMCGVTLRISDPLDATIELPANQEGQLFVQADSMFAGYFGEPASVLDNGFFATGDLACVDDDGRLTLTGRIKLLIDIGGHKVNPLEVEHVLCEHESVGWCVVVPMRLSATVFRLRAILTAKDEGTHVDIESVRAFAKRRLSPHKVPRLIEVRADLPRSATGKVLRDFVAAT